jgi:hypothetical protein
MADLFLDTQFDDFDYDRIANRLCDLGTPIEELEKLFWEDLFPTKIWNLVQFNRGGQWGGFDNDEVCDEIEEYRASLNWFEKTVVLRVNWALWGSKVDGLWDILKARILLFQDSRFAQQSPSSTAPETSTAVVETSPERSYSDVAWREPLLMMNFFRTMTTLGMGGVHTAFFCAQYVFGLGRTFAWRISSPFRNRVYRNRVPDA